MKEFERLLDAAPDAMLFMGYDGRIVYANRSAERLFGYERGGMRGEILEVLIPEGLGGRRSRRRAILEAASTLRAKHPRARLCGLRRDERRSDVELGQSGGDGALSTLQWGGRTLRVSRWWTDDDRLAVYLVDRTDDDARERELRRALDAKNEFLSRMSHELRTPLNAILGFASLLQRAGQEQLSSRQREMVSHIRESGQLLLRLVDEVLDLARVDTGHIDVLVEPVDTAERVRDVVATLEPVAASRGVSIEVMDVATSVPAVRADPLRVTQILLNLLSNAIKYGREGGHVTVGATCVDGARVRLTVQDDGPGVPLDKQPLLFQPFQRAGQERGSVDGAGIGLALSRRLATLMEGQVDFESTPGKGSNFWLELPAQA